MNNFRVSVFFKFTAVLVMGLLIGFVASNKLSTTHGEVKASDEGSEPLYWAAPMDPDFRRDEPGLSPMGMELIPVYAELAKTKDEGPGTVYISPDVVNNLGVRTASVERKTLQSEIRTVGYVKYDEDKLIHIHPRIAGWVETLYVKATGDPVAQGAPLYSLYSPELVNVQEELLIAIKRNDTRLIQATENRLQALHIPKYFIQNLKQTLKIQQTITFYTPQAGVVDNLHIREGFYVQPGTNLLSIAALDSVWVEAEIFERQAAWVKTNDLVTMSLDYMPARTWKGKVDYIYPALDAMTRTVRIRIRFDNTDRQLKPNMFTRVHIHSSSVDRSLVIPRESLIRTEHQDRVVLSLGEGSFKSVAVKTGKITPSYVEILSGLREGESVVNSAQFLLDSESSKNSDFKRLHHGNPNIQSASAFGMVNSIDFESRSVNISRGPIEKWQRPAATMDYYLAEHLDLSILSSDSKLDFLFEIHDDQFVIEEFNLLSDEEFEIIKNQTKLALSDNGEGEL